MEKEIPIEQIPDSNGGVFWVADSHIEEYPEEPARLQIIWELLKDMVTSVLSKLEK